MPGAVSAVVRHPPLLLGQRATGGEGDHVEDHAREEAPPHGPPGALLAPVGDEGHARNFRLALGPFFGYEWTDGFAGVEEVGALEPVRRQEPHTHADGPAGAHLWQVVEGEAVLALVVPQRAVARSVHALRPDDVEVAAPWEVVDQVRDGREALECLPTGGVELLGPHGRLGCAGARGEKGAADGEHRT
eukprot:CAMPEP_0206008634 /NCGR_PEP_ID=MMETSP1464-20131121/7963_1 /ASSEMBLY_ACC=CAM_ASM_001124 /TAXON_ID=119497 /ORGANISM="Exanthemachrysis gayraliae, Strain RCC1523" /LENGTH=188 /DNA_ID=CAMNT_0053382181 /DNA_START=23 /DNA_END=585 /DNA_ORIENTATION=-